MASSIIIGLGTTGLHVVEGVQQFHYQFTGNNSSDQLKYLFFETDLNVGSKGTPAGNHITAVPLPLTQMAAHIPALKSSNISHEWIPAVNTALAKGDGAGGQSAYGRLALWMNWTAARQAIYQAWQGVNGNNQTNFFIVGSLTGGTCSGSFIDMAYLVRHITGSENIYGLFLIPGRSHTGIPGGNNVLENYLIATSALNALSIGDGRIVYDCKWPDGSNISQSVAPFKYCYFLSTDYSTNNAPLGSIQELCKVAAFNIFFRVLDIQHQSSIPAYLLNAKTALPGYQHGTFGSILIHYPEAQLKEYFGLDLCKTEVLSRWIDSEYWLDKHGLKQPVDGQRDKINAEFGTDFEKKLSEALGSIDGMQVVGASNIHDAIKRDVEKFRTDKQFNLYQLFSSDYELGHYGFVANNSNTIKKNLIDEIYRLFDRYMQDYQNLFVLKNIILNDNSKNPRSLQRTLQDILDFWQRQYGIDGSVANYGKALRKKVNEIERNKFLPSVVLQSNEYLEEQFYNLYMLCKLHVTVDIIKQIQKALDARPEDGLVLQGNQYTLPSQTLISQIIKKVEDVLSSPKNEATITKRMEELRTEMNSSSHFKALFTSNCDDDLQKLRNDYGNLPPTDRFTGRELDNGHLFDYLVHSNNNALKIYNDCVKSGIDFVSNKNLVKSQNITTLLGNLAERQPIDPQYQSIRRFFEDNEINIRAELPGLIGLRSQSQPAVQFQLHNRLKLLYSTAKMDTLLDKFRNAAPQSYLQSVSTQNQSGVEISEFGNAIVIYQEYGYMVNDTVFNPITDISINAPIKRHVEAILKNNTVMARCPYISAETLQEEINKIPE